jgi:hypothetical protein
MMRITYRDGEVCCETELKGRIAVYLDNDSIIDLSKGPAGRRDRFLAAIERGGTLLFSLTNALEVAGPQGASAAAVEAFLDGIGPRWVPLELSPWKAVRKEQGGAGPQSPVSKEFIAGFVPDRMHEMSPEGAKILDLSPETFFKLSAVVRWERKRRAERTPGEPSESERLDECLRDCIVAYRTDFERDPASLDRALPVLPFAAAQPANFALNSLLRLLVLESRSHQLKKNDGIDLCHAVLASAYAHIGTLDRQWKRRIRALPHPNSLAEVYYRTELDAFLERLEWLVASRSAG